MAPPPFKVIGPLPEPLTVEETAATFSVSPASVAQLMTALRTSLAKASGSKAAKTSKVVKISMAASASRSAKAAKLPNAGKTPGRRTRQASKAAARSSR